MRGYLNFRKSTLFIFIAFITVSCNNTSSKIKISDLRCEYRTNPLGIDNTSPRLSWKLVEEKQTRGQKNESPWSESSTFSMGILNEEEWKGEWIYKEDQKKTEHNWYRKNFTLSEEATSAFVHVGSFGYHELYVNGEKITENVMKPVSSFMKKRIPYLTYDVSDQLRKGDNVIAIWHAAGWARLNRTSEYRNPPFVFKAQAEINAVVYDATALNKKHPEVEVEIAMNSQRSIKVKTRYNRITAKLSAQMVEPQVKFKEVRPIGIKDNGDGMS